MLELLVALGSIILVDLVLSGDNALVIGAAAAGLPRRQRWYAIALGGIGAIVLRIAFAILATLLLRLPLLQAFGALLLLFIAMRLLMDRDEAKQVEAAENANMGREGEPVSATDEPTMRSFWAALLTIMVADVTMSLDNVLAVGALAAGHIPILALGLVLSIALLLLGSALVAELIGRLPWLLDVAALVLALTAGNMILDDIRLGPVLEHFPWTRFVIPAVSLAIVIVADILLRRRDQGHAGTTVVR